MERIYFIIQATDFSLESFDLSLEGLDLRRNNVLEGLLDLLINGHGGTIPEGMRILNRWRIMSIPLRYTPQGIRKEGSLELFQFPEAGPIDLTAPLLQAIVITMKTLRKTDHPHIVRDPQVCGGEPIIKGTRIAVSCLALWHLKYSYSPEELQRLYPHLDLAQIHDALAYYFDHQAEIDAIIRMQEAEETWKAQFPTKLAARSKPTR